MDEMIFKKTLEDALDEAELKSEDIPTIDLYIDQILNLISERLKDGSERYYDRHLTKTMINNYSKEGLITPVKGKKYDKEQILQMLMIYTLKSTLSIGEIKRLLDGMYDVEGFDGEGLTEIYDRHLHIKDANKECVETIIDGIVEQNELDLQNDLDCVSLICAISALSAQLKHISQAMIDQRFPLSEEEENAQAAVGKRERKIERKKEKISAKGEARVARAEAKVAKVEAKTEVKIAKVTSKAKAKAKE